MAEKKHIGELLVEIRTALNMTQMEFAELLGMGQGTLSRLERRVMRPRPDIIQRLSDQFAADRKIRRKITRFLFLKPKLDV